MGEILVQQETTGVSSEVMAFEALAREFLDTLDVAQSTRDDYAAELARFWSWFQIDGGAMRPDTLRRYRDELLLQGLTDLSVSTYLTAPRRFFRFLHSRGTIPFIPEAKQPRSARGHRRDALTAEDLRAVLLGIDIATLIGLRDYALFALLAHVGLRTIEVERAIVGDMRPAGDTTALYVQGKGHAAKDQCVFIESPALKPLRRYLRERARLMGRAHLPDDAPLFASHGARNEGMALQRRSLRHIVSQRLEAVGVKTARLTAHSLRHTAATQALRGGAELVQVRDMMRHSDVRTTMVYLHNIERQEKRAEQYVDFGLPDFEVTESGAAA